MQKSEKSAFMVKFWIFQFIQIEQITDNEAVKPDRFQGASNLLPSTKLTLPKLMTKL